MIFRVASQLWYVSGSIVTAAPRRKSSVVALLVSAT
jgi:hypothetical protein